MSILYISYVIIRVCGKKITLLLRVNNVYISAKCKGKANDKVFFGGEKAQFEMGEKIHILTKKISLLGANLL